jgi:hypothetical protein
VDLVRRAHPARPIARGSEPRKVVLLPIVIRELGTIWSYPRLGHCKHRLEYAPAELLADAAAQGVGCIAVTDAILDDVVQDSCDDGVLILAVTGEDDGDIRRMREIRQAGALAHLLVVVLGGEGESVVDAVGIAPDHLARALRREGILPVLKILTNRALRDARCA